MNRFVLLISLFCLSAAQAQPLQLKLKSGRYTITENTFIGLQSKATSAGVALWDAPVLAEDKKALEEIGATILQYLPENAFEVLLPEGTTPEQLKKIGLSAFLPLSSEMKLDRPLSTLDIPEWAWISDQTLAVQYLSYWPLESWPKTGSHEEIGGLWYKAVLSVEDLSVLASDPRIRFIQAIEEPGQPENFNARASGRISYSQAKYPFDGTGVMVGHGDDGDIGPHADYTGRLTSFAGTSLGDHGDHVAGTIMGAGNIDPDGEGMAKGAYNYYYSYPDNLSNIDNHYNLYGIRVTNSSYSNGCNAGYTSYAAQMDQDALQNPALVHVFSAGNNNGSNCGYGAGSNWGNITGGHKQGKNVVATANITATELIAPSSSRGPAADGRIKPDLASVGTNVYSTIDPHTYDYKTGTSMAAPGAAGFFAVLHNAFDVLQNDTADGGLLKAIAMNTADDLGNAGPDFIFGYGRINAKRALQTISDTTFFTGSAATNDTLSYTIALPAGAKDFRAMLYWTDAPGSVTAAKALVNNLDFEVIDLTQNSNFKPWVMNPAPNALTLNLLPVRAVDTLNNAEQVTLQNPIAGDYELKVYGTNVPSGPQKFYVVYSYSLEAISVDYPHEGAVLEPGANYVRWMGPTANLNWSYSTDGSTWTGVSLNPISGQNVATWNVPSTPTDHGFLRLISGTDTAVSGPFTLLAQPTGLSIDWACPDSIKITVAPVSGATAYTAYILGTKYMDSVMTSTSNAFVIPYAPNNSTWISASGNINGAHGKRAYAIELPAGTYACPLPRDAALTTIINPSLITSCHNGAIEVQVEVLNPSTQIMDTIAMAFQYMGSTVRDTLFGNLMPYQDTTFTFTTTLNWSGTASQTLKAWTELSGDQNALNDTVNQVVTYLNSTLYSLPFSQDFNNFSTCGTATNCGGTSCALGGDFTNLTNGSADDIDWRTLSGGTQSSNTGPSADMSGSGKYLYLESSGTCDFQRAELLSPCIDLGTSIAPELSFGYHMYGADMGDLEVQLFDGKSWHSVFTKSGNQGNSWQTAVVELLDFAGDTVILKFIGTTGATYLSDLAIDGIEVYDNVGVPEANFTASTTTPCLNTGITLNDLSTKTPTAWNWSLSPSTFSFINGTSATSQHPEVSFAAYGNYSVTLIASNAYGSDTVTISNFIQVAPLPGLPLVETWTGSAGSDFSFENPDGITTWSKGEVDGISGAKSEVMYMNYFNYNAVGTRDAIVSPKVDISGAVQPVLYFDISYAPYSSAYSDSLIVEVSTDCGSTYAPLYAKQGTDLATAPNSTGVYVPSGASAWRTDSIPLGSIGGDFVQFRIVGVCGYGNNLYLDNIRIIDAGSTPSTATFTHDPICEDEPFTFALATSDSTLDGNFTLNRQGSSLISTFLGMGAHSSTLNIATNYDMEYVYFNASTFVVDSAVLHPGPKLNASFTLASAGGLSYTFTDGSTPAPTGWAWDFGDGSTSTAQNPTHAYTTGGAYQVKLVVTTACGQDSVVIPFNNIGLAETNAPEPTLYPNPTHGDFTIFVGPLQGEASIEIHDLRGALVQQNKVILTSENWHGSVQNLPAGLYTATLSTESGQWTWKVTKL
jgi:PKD repeat protein